ncbi:MAG: hypothetical protein ACOH1R_05830 [Luteimonas sp.]
MRSAGKLDGERTIAYAVVLGVHLLFWWVLTRATSVFVAVDADAGALQVTWIEPPLAANVEPVVADNAGKSSAQSGQDRRTPLQVVPPPDAALTTSTNTDTDTDTAPTTPTDTPTASTSMSAVFIEQGKRWAESRGDGDGFARDPLANRSASLPGRHAETFRMRKPISPQAVVNAVGRYLFAPPGYATDPCQQIRENIAGLGPGGDGALLQEELRRKRAYCH